MRYQKDIYFFKITFGHSNNKTSNHDNSGSTSNNNNKWRKRDYTHIRRTRRRRRREKPFDSLNYIRKYSNAQLSVERVQYMKYIYLFIYTCMQMGWFHMRGHLIRPAGHRTQQNRCIFWGKNVTVLSRFFLRIFIFLFDCFIIIHIFIGMCLSLRETFNMLDILVGFDR